MLVAAVGALLAEVDEDRQPDCGGGVQGREDVAPGCGDVVGRARLDRGDPDREPVRVVEDPR